MANDKIYCGIKDVPKNSRKGTMLECAKKHQVKLYGIHKVDKKLLDIDKINKVQQEKSKIQIKIRTLKFRIRKRKDILEEIVMKFNKEKAKKSPNEKLMQDWHKKAQKLAKEGESAQKELLSLENQLKSLK